MTKASYKKRIRLPLCGKQDVDFFTRSSLRIARGYERIILGKKPIVEFTEKNVNLKNVDVPFHKRWRKEDKSTWIEYQSKDYCRVKIRFCKARQRFYCSLLDLIGRNNQELIDRP